MAFSLRIPALGLAILAIGVAAPMGEAEAQHGHFFHPGGMGGFHGGGFHGGGFRGGGFRGGGFPGGGFHGGGFRAGGFRGGGFHGGGFHGAPFATGSIGRVHAAPGFGYRPGIGGYYGRPYRWGGYYGRYYGYRPYYAYRYRYPYAYSYGYPYYGYYGYPYDYYYDDSGAIAAGLIGGLALGAIASANHPAYYYPYGCHYERLRVVNAYHHVVVRRVRVCS
ncbi:hypothetical protein [Microvirga flavescens]|uniref:hypothetical protein n=1 Tax=Microvirga flavescens TaxID=2249811 RepID=UPI0018E0C44F|nr:hypothetical protein [Microvirga flavescens]